MTEEDFTNLKYDVDRHKGDLDKLSKRIDKLQADLEVIIAFTNNTIANLARQQVGEAKRPLSNWSKASVSVQHAWRNLSVRLSWSASREGWSTRGRTRRLAVAIRGHYKLSPDDQMRAIPMIEVERRSQGVCCQAVRR